MRLLIAMAWAFIAASQFSCDLVAIRDAYAPGAKQKPPLKLFNEFFVAAPKVPVIFCYHRAAEMMEAKYAINPINKLSAFGKGKQLIESSIPSVLDTLECRFIRYAIQRILPAMLICNGSLKGDSILIVRGIDTPEDVDLKRRILNFIKRN